jgi:hypothetical protein
MNETLVHVAGPLAVILFVVAMIWVLAKGVRS